MNYDSKVPDNTLNKAVASELDELRVKRGISQPQLSELTGIPTVSLQRYLAGTRAIRLDDLALIAYALDGDPAVVFTRAAARVQRER